MKVKKKYIQLALFVLLFSFGACNSDEMSESNNPRDVQEQMVLRLAYNKNLLYIRGG